MFGSGKCAYGAHWTICCVDVEHINDARYNLFFTSSRPLENIPPTQATLFEHAKRSLLQASFIWKQVTVSKQILPDFDKWGWVWDDYSKICLPFWTTLADTIKACAIFLHCGCKVQRHVRRIVNIVKQVSDAHRCASQCEGGCINNDETVEV